MAGALVSLGLGSIMFLVLKAPCLYCLVTHLSNLLSVALLWPAFSWKPDFHWRPDHCWHFLSLAAIALLGAVALYFADQTRTLEARIEATKRTIW